MLILIIVLVVNTSASTCARRVEINSNVATHSPDRHSSITKRSYKLVRRLGNKLLGIIKILC